MKLTVLTIIFFTTLLSISFAQVPLTGMNYTLPKNDAHYKCVKGWVEDKIDTGYHHPSAATIEEMKDFRKIQPEVMFRARGIGNYGDYYTPEGFIPGNQENTDIVAKGGNFMIGVGPDGDGRFDPQVIKDLKAAETWLKINGEAIYAIGNSSSGRITGDVKTSL